MLYFKLASETNPSANIPENLFLSEIACIPEKAGTSDRPTDAHIPGHRETPGSPDFPHQPQKPHSGKRKDLRRESKTMADSCLSKEFEKDSKKFAAFSASCA